MTSVECYDIDAMARKLDRLQCSCSPQNAERCSYAAMDGGSFSCTKRSRMIAAALREAREAALKEAASIARGNVHKEHYRTWPHFNPEGNLANEDQATRLADATADAILALAHKKG